MSNIDYTFELPIESLYEFFRSSKIIADVNVEIREEEFYIKSLHSSQNYCVVAHLPKDNFTKYPQTPQKPPLAFTIDSQPLIPWLSKQRETCTFIVSTKDDTVSKVTIKQDVGGLKKQKTFEVLALGKFPNDIKVQFSSSFVLSYESVKELLKELKEADPVIYFKISATKLLISDQRTLELDFTNMQGTSIKHTEPEPTTETYISKYYLTEIFSNIPKTPLTFQYKQDAPLIINYFTHKIILAPIIVKP